MDFIPEYKNIVHEKELSINPLDEIKKQLIDEKTKNQKLKEKIKKLKKDLLLEREKNITIEKEKIELKNLTDKTIAELNNKIKTLKLNLKNKTKDMKTLNNDSIILNDKKSLNFNQDEDYTAIAIAAKGFKFIHPLPCKLTDKFVKLEEKFLEYYPQFQEKEPLYTINGKKIYRFKTLEENGIKCHNIIFVKGVE